MQTSRSTALRIRACRLAVLAVMLAACTQQPPVEGTSTLEPHVVHCPGKLPEFTTGSRQRQSQAQDAQLCDCVWGRLEDWERQTSVNIVRDTTLNVPERYLQTFPSRLDGAIRVCLGH
jgi:hypothetical protein